jgi:hypothetical protein
MVVAERQYPVGFHHPAELPQDFIGANKAVEDIIQQDSIHTIVREPGAAIGLYGRNVLDPFSCRYPFDLPHGERMDVERMNPAGRPHQFRERRNITPRAAAEVQHGGSGFYPCFLQHIQTMSKKVANLEHELHQLEAQTRHWLCQGISLLHALPAEQLIYEFPFMGQYKFKRVIML